MSAALLRSGYLLELRLHDWFQSQKMRVELNQPYTDLVSGKTRETDLIAEGLLEPLHLIESGKKDILGFLEACFIVECTNNPVPYVFFESPNSGMVADDFPYACVPKTLAEDARLAVFNSELGVHSFHHYNARTISTQYCSFKQKNKSQRDAEWMAWHDDEQFDAIDKLCNEREFFRQKMQSDFLKGEQQVAALVAPYEIPDALADPPWGTAIMIFFYPVLVLQGELYKAIVDHSAGSLALQKCDHVLFRKTHIQLNKEIRLCASGSTRGAMLNAFVVCLSQI